jgi:hypothetical protein
MVSPANSHVSALSLMYSMEEDLRRDIASPAVASTQSPPLLLFYLKATRIISHLRGSDHRNRVVERTPKRMLTKWT